MTNLLEKSIVLFLTPYFSNCFLNWYRQCLALKKTQNDVKVNLAFVNHLSTVNSWEQSKIVDYASKCKEFVNEDLIYITILDITNVQYDLQLNIDSISLDYDKFIFNIFCLASEFLKNRYDIFSKLDYTSIDYYIEKAIMISLYKLVPYSFIGKNIVHNHTKINPDIEKIGYILEENQKKQFEINKQILEDNKKILEKIEKTTSESLTKTMSENNNSYSKNKVSSFNNDTSKSTKEVVKNFIGQLQNNNNNQENILKQPFNQENIPKDLLQTMIDPDLNSNSNIEIFEAYGT